MFKLVTGKNGRSVYAGRVSMSLENAVAIQGKEYNKEAKAMQDCEWRLSIDQELLRPELNGINMNIAPGSYIMTTVMPHRSQAGVGVAEEIARGGQCIAMENESGAIKYCIFGKVYGKRWNEKHNFLSVNFYGMRDTNGNYVGYESRYNDEQTGEEKVSHWLNVSFFNSTKYENYFSANWADENINAGDMVLIIATQKTSSDSTGRTFVNYNASKVEIIEKAQVTAAPVATPTSNEPNAYPIQQTPPQVNADPFAQTAPIQQNVATMPQTPPQPSADPFAQTAPAQQNTPTQNIQPTTATPTVAPTNVASVQQNVTTMPQTSPQPSADPFAQTASAQQNVPTQNVQPTVAAPTVAPTNVAPIQQNIQPSVDPFERNAVGNAPQNMAPQQPIVEFSGDFDALAGLPVA